jgi:hypothetical protein
MIVRKKGNRIQETTELTNESKPKVYNRVIKGEVFIA